MLISLETLYKKYNLKINGILHVGAHECEELKVYNKVGVTDIIWIDGNDDICKRMRLKYPDQKIYTAIISDTDNQIVDFIITNNGQSSSILELEEHKIQHPQVYEVERRKLTTTTIKTLFDEQKLDIGKYNFLNCDTQGAELLVLKGIGEDLKKFDYLYLEVNTKHLYKDCPLLPEILDYVGKFGFRQVELKMTPHFWGDIFMVRVDSSIPKIISTAILNDTSNYNLGYNICDFNTNGEKLVLSSLINKNTKIIFDVGANIGDWTASANFAGVNSTIYSFEPIPKLFESLNHRFKNNPLIKINPFAISNIKGKTNFDYYPDNSGLSGIHNRQILNDLGFTKINFDVDLITLDEFCLMSKIESIDFLKIDTEGNEYFVLLGAKDLLSNSKIRYIQFEYGGTYTDSKTTLKDVYDFLRGNKYKIYKITTNFLVYIPEWTSNLENYLYSNFLAVKE